jgi:hypothetical protein
LPDVPERTLDSMLRELRTVDRDRDRILPSNQIAAVVRKYQVKKRAVDNRAWFRNCSGI